MTDFNNMPLAEQLNALQAGDWVETNNGSKIKTEGWYDEAKGMILLQLSDSFTSIIHASCVVRVVRPTVRKVPEVVGELRRILREHDSPHNPLMEIVRALADHFEKETP